MVQSSTTRHQCPCRLINLQMFLDWRFAMVGSESQHEISDLFVDGLLFTVRFQPKDVPFGSHMF